MTTTSRGRKFTYDIINTQLWERESARSLKTIRRVGFLQKLSTVDNVTKYRDIPVSRFLRRSIIVGHFLIPRIPALSTRVPIWTPALKSHKILRTCYLSPWLGPSLTTVQYVMYFRFG